MYVLLCVEAELMHMCILHSGLLLYAYMCDLQGCMCVSCISLSASENVFVLAYQFTKYLLITKQLMIMISLFL